MKAPSIAQEVDAMMRQIYPAEFPGAALLIEKKRQVIIEKGYGLADMKRKKAITVSTNFRMASVSKQFTAMSIMLLAAEGRLSVHDLLTAYLSPLPPALRTVSVHQLLTHTSGVMDYESLIPQTRKTQVLDEDILKWIRRKDSTYFSPGTKFKYSNTGYCLLSLVVQKISGIPYRDFVRNHIFIPLKMDRSVIYVPGAKVPERAYGYQEKTDVWDIADQNMTSATRGDGGVYTSLRDYRKWSNGLSDGRWLRGPWPDGVFTGYANVGGGIKYGYGWFIAKEKDGTTAMFHSGESTGFRNIVYRNPQKGLLVLIFTNRDDDLITRAFDKIAGLTEIKIDLSERDLDKKQPSLFHWLSGVYND